MLALFLGGLGIHRFYLGQNKKRNILFAILLDVYSFIDCMYRFFCLHLYV
ncbi:NINE protein [Chryseobacterium sp. Hurlbut01]|nr:NINE protein [Chryseobacterium sp. Hurlbut01]